MKKLLAFSLALVMLCTLTACGGSDTAQTTETDQTPAEATTQEDVTVEPQEETTTEPETIIDSLLAPTYSSPYVVPGYFLGYDYEGNLVDDILTFQETGDTITITVDGRYQTDPIPMDEFYWYYMGTEEEAKVIAQLGYLDVTDLETNETYSMYLDHRANWDDLETDQYCIIAIYGEKVDYFTPTIFACNLYHGEPSATAVELRDQYANTTWVDEDGNILEITDHELIINGTVGYFTFHGLVRAYMVAYGKDDAGELYQVGFSYNEYANTAGGSIYYRSIDADRVIYSVSFVQQ
ncbi:hypothetical protein RFF05_08060 [Bengtsoniella intestinalis]|uniref:LptM family lipoprotein n=1 Tax=Bengtsoniella intestinalis TaxID=3073143 RepID=UPI00391EEAA0